MDYAIILYFDDETEVKFNGLIEQLACKSNNYMIDNKIPPHITISMFSTSEISKAEHVISSHIHELKKCEIVWASIGTFIPQVLFAAPVMNQQLIDVYETTNRLLEPVSDSQNRFYQFNSWVPHTTLATKMTIEELHCAFEAVSHKFTPLSGCANRIALVECNPYKELHVWQL